MHSDERRKAIADVLRASDVPISASALAEKFSVSRQIIVGDIALFCVPPARRSLRPRAAT